MQAIKSKFISEERMKVVNIPLDIIHPNPNQPRKVFDTASLEELADSIRQNGVIQPITVRRAGQEYEIIAGERRWRACVSLAMPSVPAIVINADDAKSALLALLENLQREDLCFFEIAEAYQKLLREQGMTQDELAKRMGKSQSTIANKLRLLRLSPKTRLLIREYGLTERHARAILSVSSEDEQERILKIIHDRQLNVKQTEELINSAAAAPKKKKRELFPFFKDLSIFTNTIKQAVAAMEHNGVKTNVTKNDFDWGIEYIIKLEK